MQLYEGSLKSWKVDKGFGFIQPNGGGKDVFVHIRDLKHSNYQPQIGDNVCFKIVADKDGKIRAYDAFVKGQEITRQQIRTKSFDKNQSKTRVNRGDWLGMKAILLIAALPFVASALLIQQKQIFYPFFVYLLMSLLTFFVYAVDKTKAHKNEWRTTEQTIHLFELLGGWPGALITQRVIRHKNKKTSFQVIFWMIVTIHIVIWLDVLFFNSHGLSTILCKLNNTCRF
jgi:uncharacterized membrane protein YsdA (DUF1294 family)/cold shock CspA family protein